MFTLDNLKAAVEVEYLVVRKALEESQTLDPYGVVLKGMRSLKVPLPPEAMNKPEMKTLLFKALGSVAAEYGADGLLIVSDGWTLEQTDEQSKRMNDAAYRAEMMRVVNEVGVPGAAAAGYGRLVEVLGVFGQAGNLTAGLAHSYERVGADGVIPATALTASVSISVPHTIRFIGEPRRFDSDSAQASGRIFPSTEANTCS